MFAHSDIASFLVAIAPDTSPVSPKLKILEAAVAMAQSLSQWALVIIGGTLAIIVGTSYYRPDSRRVRAIYLLFVPAWILLALSISNGSLIQRRYLAYLFLNPENPSSQATVTQIISKVNDEAYWQLITLEWALLCLGVWLLFYLVWWIRTEDKHDDL